MATANNDVDIYNSPVEPREILERNGEKMIMRKGHQGKVLSHHADGWYQLELDVPGGSGWVAEDHLTLSKSNRYEDLPCYPICRSQCLGTRDIPWDECIKQCFIGIRC